MSIADGSRIPDERFSPTAFYASCPADTVTGCACSPHGRGTTHRTLLLGIARRVTLAVAGLISCLLVYPLTHEAGHLLPAVWSGAEVDRFVWTPLLGHPHVSLNQVSGTARPWVDAGGVLLPTGLGTLLIASWLLLPTAAPSPVWRLWLLIPGGVLLLGNLGLFLEVCGPADSYAHMAGLARRLAGGGGAALVVELSPALWSCLLIGWVIRRICQQRRSSGASVSGPAEQSAAADGGGR